MDGIPDRAPRVIGGALLLEDAGGVGAGHRPGSGIAAMVRASHERLRQSMEAIEKRLAQVGWRVIGIVTRADLCGLLRAKGSSGA